jgi:hypothetical protein
MRDEVILTATMIKIHSTIELIIIIGYLLYCETKYYLNELI